MSTSNHKIGRLNSQMAPCIANPNCFNLSYPSICQQKFSPELRYSLLSKHCLLLCWHPIGSSLCIFAWRHLVLFIACSIKAFSTLSYIPSTFLISFEILIFLFQRQSHFYKYLIFWAIAKYYLAKPFSMLDKLISLLRAVFYR